MRLRTTLVLSLLSSTALLMPGGPAQAKTVSEPLLSTSSPLTVVGHGYGHGRGLSQYGAQGAALRGVKSHQILASYYPGTTAEQFVREVRVLITGDNDDDLVVRAEPGLSIADYGAHKAYKLPDNGARLWKLFTSYGVTKVSYLSANDGWVRYALGGKPALDGVGEFRSSKYVLNLRTKSGDRKYRGAMRYIYKNTVNRLSLESYLKGVVPAEMPTHWRADALEAQSVAARSYAAREMVDNPNRSYHVYDDTRSQVYRGIGSEARKSNLAIAETAGTILTYEGKPALTQFSSSNGGWTATGATQGYLVGKYDKFEQYSSNPNADWRVPVSTAALQRAYPAIGTLTGIQVLARDGNGDWGGRVTDIRLVGKSGEVTIGGSDFRSVLGLKSTYFTLVR